MSPPPETPAPGRYGWLHALGALVGFLLLVQAVTGVLLSAYYRPTADLARPSTIYVMTHVHCGWLVRSIHYWTAEALLVLALITLLHVYFSRRYRAPHHWSWVLGLCILLLLFGFRFTGQLLPYDEPSFHAVVMASRVISRFPLLGEELMETTLGSPQVSDTTLGRFFVAHVLVLPVLLAGACVLLHRLHRRRSPEAAPERPFHPRVTLLLAAIGVFYIGCAVLAAGFAPARLAGPLQQLTPPDSVLPEWYFAGLHALLNLFPGGARAVGYVCAGLPWLVLFGWPFLERRFFPGRDRLATGVGAAACCIALGLSLLAYWR